MTGSGGSEGLVLSNVYLYTMVIRGMGVAPTLSPKPLSPLSLPDRGPHHRGWAKQDYM